MEKDSIAATLNTTRVCGGNVFQNAIEISNIVYADKSPYSIILVNVELYQDAFSATSLIHFPNNAPILFTYMDNIPQITLNQIYKLRPKGVNGIHVFIVGGISDNVEQQLMILGLTTKRLSGSNFLETSAQIADYLNFPENIMVVSGEDYRDGLSACAWAAHMGDPILFSGKDYLPQETIDVIRNTKNPNVYIIGNSDSISEKVVYEIKRLNAKYVDRISGDTPYEVAVNFAKYKSPAGNFGWGRTYRDGHAFTFTSVIDPIDNASGALFAHLGKHTPILVVEKDILPVVTKDYIESVKPLPKPEPHPPFMHGWIIGCDNEISAKTQVEIERALSIDELHMRT